MLTANSQPEAHSQELLWAVISYVPADIAWCEWLYFTLNGYAVPVVLMARATRDGFGLPQELTVFPDPNDRDYVGRYQQALEAGRYLVVICSPNSEHCDTVENHIRDFKRAGGEERIIVLVVEGEPTKGAGRMNPGPSKWLPPWLRWRIDENGFFRTAERSEPQIIDARPGRMNLDDIMASLLAALLDIPRSEFDVVSGPEPLAPSRDESLLMEHDGMVEQIWNELAAPAQPATTAPAPAVVVPAPASVPAVEKGTRAGKVFPTILGVSIFGVAALALGAAVGWLMSPGLESRGEHAGKVSLIRSQPTKEEAAAPERPETTPQTPSAAPTIVKAKMETTVAPPQENGSAASPPAIGSASVPRPAPAPAPTPTVAVATAPPQAPVSAITAIVPAPAQQLAPPSSLLTPRPPATEPASTNIPSIPAPAVLSPEQIAEQAANLVLKEATDARTRADRLMRDGQAVEALPFYIRALNSTERYSALRPGDESAEVETAKLCLIVGSLQATYASTAEARQTLDAGRRMLGKVKGKGSDERGRTLNSLQLQIRRLDDDAPRRRADRD